MQHKFLKFLYASQVDLLTWFYIKKRHFDLQYFYVRKYEMFRTEDAGLFLRSS